MTSITFEELQIQNLITFDYVSITKNFKTIDSFIKNFANFQRKFADLQKIQKAASQDLSNFKMSTSNTFSTMNEILDSRGSISKGNNKVIEDDVNQVKKTIKQLKNFVTESTRDLNQSLQAKQKQTKQVYKNFDAKFAEINTFRQSDKLRIQSLESEVYTIKGKYSLRTESEILKSNLYDAKQQISRTKAQIEKTQQFLQSLGVKEFKQTLDSVRKGVQQELSTMRTKLKLKTDVSDTLKLEEMLLNTINLSYQNVARKYSNKNQTKKALIYIEKRINSIIQNLFSQQQTDKNGLIVAKNWKCISCAKDLGEYQGKLDKFKPWAVFPAKDANNKDKYGGFGTAFQSVVQTAVSKKGGEMNYDQKGRMTTPFNLTREVQSSLKPSHSQHKLSNHNKSPSKLVSESNYMSLFGRNSEIDFDVRAQYLQKEKGLLQLSKIKFE